MNDVALSGGGGALAASQGNFFEAYGEQASQKSITGTLLKFSKGDWVTGDGHEIAVNTSLIANMDHLMIGWIRWANNKPTDQIMGRISQGYKPELRSTLGDTDESLWEREPGSNKPRDPWQFTNYLVMKEPVGEGELFTFTTSSRGGLGAIGDLCRAYGKSARMRPDEFPIVALRVDSYTHDTYGKIKTPVLTIVGWAPKSNFEAVDQADEGAGAATAAETDIRPASSSGREPRGAASYAAPAAAAKF